MCVCVYLWENEDVDVDVDGVVFIYIFKVFLFLNNICLINYVFSFGKTFGNYGKKNNEINAKKKREKEKLLEYVKYYTIKSNRNIVYLNNNFKRRNVFYCSENNIWNNKHQKNM